APDDPRGIADRDATVGKVAGHHRAGTDDDVLADRRARQHDRSVPEPRAVADHDGPRRRELTPDRRFGVEVPVVGVGDVHVMAGEDVVADHDALLAHDRRALADQRVVADRHHLGVTEVLLRRHTGRQARVRSEHRSLADADVALAEERGDREADRAPRTEAPEATGPRTRRADRAPLGESIPEALDDVAGQGSQPVVELAPSGGPITTTRSPSASDTGSDFGGFTRTIGRSPSSPNFRYPSATSPRSRAAATIWEKGTRPSSRTYQRAGLIPIAESTASNRSAKIASSSGFSAS